MLRRLFIVVGLVVLLVGCGGEAAKPALSMQGQRTQDALNAGQKCTAIWNENSSLSGEATTISGVRELNGGTQYYAHHPREAKDIWTWEERLDDVACR